jgi:O-antigen ligase
MILMWATAAMSIMAIIEYFFPSVAHLLPGVFTKASFMAQDGFQRAQFSFWGYPAAASLISWGAFITFDFITHARSPRTFAIGLAIFAVDIIAIFISGQRSSWLALPVGLIILNLDGKIRTVLITIALMLVALLFVPSSLWKRLNTISSIVGTGKVVDTSSQQRLDRWQSGIEELTQNPLTGSGYGGWLLHDAFLEIGAHLGVIPMIVFIIFLIQVILNILVCRGIPRPEAKRYALVFLALSVPWIIQMTVETDLQTPPFAVAQWVFLAIAWYLPDIFHQPSEISVQAEVMNEVNVPTTLTLKEFDL